MTTRTTVRGECSLAALRTVRPSTLRMRRSVTTRSKLALERLDGHLPAVGHRHLVAGLAQHDREQIAHALLVVDDQHPSVRHERPEA